MIRLYGYSDDNIEIRGQYDDEIPGDDLVFVVGNPEATPGQDAAGVSVRMEYAPDWHSAGVWTASLAPLDEDCAIPWPVTIEATGYTVVVSISCPPGTPVSAYRRRPGKKPDRELVWQNGRSVESE